MAINRSTRIPVLTFDPSAFRRVGFTPRSYGILVALGAPVLVPSGSPAVLPDCATHRGPLRPPAMNTRRHNYNTQDKTKHAHKHMDLQTHRGSDTAQTLGGWRNLDLTSPTNHRLRRLPLKMPPESRMASKSFSQACADLRSAFLSHERLAGPCSGWTNKGEAGR